jgi:hypothetical protein
LVRQYLAAQFIGSIALHCPVVNIVNNGVDFNPRGEEDDDGVTERETNGAIFVLLGGGAAQMAAVG